MRLKCSVEVLLFLSFLFFWWLDSNVTQVQKHIRKCFAGIKVLELVAPGKGGSRSWEAVGIRSGVLSLSVVFSLP